MFELLKAQFRRLSPMQVAANELADARLNLLSHQTAEAYARAMIAYNVETIKRLENFLSLGGVV